MCFRGQLLDFTQVDSVCEKGDIICFVSSLSLCLFRHDHLIQFKEATEYREMCPAGLVKGGRAIGSSIRDSGGRTISARGAVTDCLLLHII
jgi:hypothetical protein